MMKKEFLVERQGRTFVLYAGILSLAHEMGLVSIETSLVQIPSEANNRVAICTCVATFERDGVTRRFTGIADAAPNNVAPAMVNCVIRMAETRAKARALRDGINIAVAAFEELGEEDAYDAAPEERRSSVPRPRRQSTARPPLKMSPEAETTTPERDPALISEGQETAIRNMAKRYPAVVKNIDQWCQGIYQVTLCQLSAEQAADAIRKLNTGNIAEVA